MDPHEFYCSTCRIIVEMSQAELHMVNGHPRYYHRVEYDRGSGETVAHMHKLIAQP